MLSSIDHIQVNVSPTHMDFYKELMEFLGWKELHIDEMIRGYLGGNNASIWFSSTPDRELSDHDNVGVNHIGINVTEQEDVDSVVEFLQSKSVEALFDTPRHRPDFAASETDTYYQVMFRSPDQILFEVVYTGSKK